MSGIRLLLQKGIFKSIITGKWEETGGYIKIPSGLYPITQSIDGESISNKAHYRMQVLAAYRNTNNLTSVEIQTDDIKRNVVPEEYKLSKNKNLEYRKKNPFKSEPNKEFDSMAGKDGSRQHNYFSTKLRNVHDILYYQHLKVPILRNIYFGSKRSTLYYTTSANESYYLPNT